MAKDLELQYAEYNRKHFGNSLPVIPVKWKTGLTLDSDACYGVTWFVADGSNEAVPRKIEICSSLRPHPAIWKMTLLHEAVHVKLPYGSGHGRLFIREMKRLAAKGAFNDLW